jgi:macrodomain Ter protein organizer (MatP/YcbG family)
MILNMHSKKKIILNTDDIVANRKTLSLKLNVWKKVISCAVHEEITISKLINKLIDKHIEENNYNVEDMFNNKLEVKQILYRENEALAIDYKFDKQF